jgi:hypothetical protein
VQAVEVKVHRDRRDLAVELHQGPLVARHRDLEADQHRDLEVAHHHPAVDSQLRWAEAPVAVELSQLKEGE